MGVTLCQSEGTHQIVTLTSMRVFDLKKGLFNYGQDIDMAFSPPVVGCLVKKALQRGGHGHPRTPPGYSLVAIFYICPILSFTQGQIVLKVVSLFLNVSGIKP